MGDFKSLLKFVTKVWIEGFLVLLDIYSYSRLNPRKKHDLRSFENFMWDEIF